MFFFCFCSLVRQHCKDTNQLIPFYKGIDADDEYERRRSRGMLGLSDRRKILKCLSRTIFSIVKKFSRKRGEIINNFNWFSFPMKFLGFLGFFPVFGVCVCVWVMCLIEDHPKKKSCWWVWRDKHIKRDERRRRKKRQKHQSSSRFFVANGFFSPSLVSRC